MTSLENTFTHCFSVKQVRRESLIDLVSFLQVAKLTLVGCPDHRVALTNRIIKFYVLARLHFHVKRQNSQQKPRREQMKLLKLRRVLSFSFFSGKKKLGGSAVRCPIIPTWTF